MSGSVDSTNRIAIAWPQLRERASRLLRKPTLKALLAAHVVVVVVILARGQGWLQPLELLAYDNLRVAWAGGKTSDRIVLVGATEDDITATGPDGDRRWGWPLRDGDLANILERLVSWKPRAIGVDVYRDVPEPPGAEHLAAIMKAHPEIYWVFKLEGNGSRGVPPPKVLRGRDRAVLADTIPDPENVVRRGLLYADDGSNNHPSLGLALAVHYLRAEHIAPQPGSGDDLRLGKALISPLDESRGPYLQLDSRGYQVLLDYHGGPQPFPTHSLREVMDDKDLADRIRGRIVIVGVTAESVKDSFVTPFSTGFNNAAAVNGMAIHGHLADQLIRQALDGAAIVTGMSRPFENMWIWVWAVGGAALGLIIRSTLPSVMGVLAGLLCIGLIVYVAFGFAQLLPVVPAMLSWATASVLTNQVLHAASNRARARLRRSFEHYLPPAIIAQMVDADQLPQLGGERRDISVLFTDVAGYTTFSEERDPEELARISNEYFDGVCAAIFAHGGLVNSFMGDGVLAFFGAPLVQPDHADRAVAAALDIDSFGQQFSMEQRARGIEFGKTRIGVHTGSAFVGNVGSRERLQYTALGDMLNTGSRLEGLNKAIGTRVCVSDAVADKCERHRFRKVGSFVLKGRHGATDVSVPIDPSRHPSERVARYEDAFGVLEAEAPHAVELFAALHREDPTDECVAFHYHRLLDGERGSLIEMQEK